MKKRPPKRSPSPREQRRLARERFLRARRAEAGFRRELFTVSSQVDALVRGWAPFHDIPGLRAALARYAEIIQPWARAVTANMHSQVSLRDLSSWVELGRTMGKELRKVITSAPVGEAMRAAMAEQVALITSLPTHAAERVHRLTTEAIIESTRFEVIAEKIMATGHVTRGRARLIARTEVARTASILMESRAKYVGSTHYIWHTSEDSDVRATHRKLNRRTFAWAEAPVSEETGERSHPGQIWNCRCWAEPILP